MDNINFIDTVYSTIQADGKGSYSQIRAKTVSRENMTKKYGVFLANLKRELEEAKQDLVSSEYPVTEEGQLTETGASQLVEKTVAVATLEGIVNVLTGIPVRCNFIASRAIKLRDNMIGNFRHNSEVAYITLSQEAQASKIFDERNELYPADPMVNVEKEETVSENVDNTFDNNVGPIEIPDRGWNPEEGINPVIEPNVEEPKENNEQDTNTFISSDEIDNVLTEFMNKQNEEENVVEEENAKEVEDSNENVVEPTENVVEPIPEDESKDEEEITKVSQNESAEARIAKFDPEGVKRYAYTPLTEDEVEQAREKLNFAGEAEEEVKDEESVAIAGPIEEEETSIVAAPQEEKEEAIVVPEREEKEDEKVKEEPDKEINFDLSEVTKNDVEMMISGTKSKEQLKELLKAIRDSKAQLAEAKDEQKQSEEELANKNKEADEAKKARSKSEKERDNWEVKLKSLRDNISEEIKSTNEFNSNLRSSIEEKERFISEQRRETEENNEMIEEIKAVLSEEGEIKKR